MAVVALPLDLIGDSKRHDAGPTSAARVLLTGESTVTGRYLLQQQDQLMSNLRSANDCVNAILAIASVLFYNSYIHFAPFTAKRMAHLPHAHLPSAIARQCTACKGVVSGCQLCGMMTSMVGLLRGAGICLLESQTGLGLSCLTGATVDLGALQEKMVDMIYGHYRGFQTRAANPQIELASAMDIPEPALRQIPPAQSLTGAAGKDASNAFVIRREENATAQLRATYKQAQPALVQRHSFKATADLARKAAIESGVGTYVHATLQMKRAQVQSNVEKRIVFLPTPDGAPETTPPLISMKTALSSVPPVDTIAPDNSDAMPPPKKRLACGALTMDAKAASGPATTEEILSAIRKTGSASTVRVEFASVKKRLSQDTGGAKTMDVESDDGWRAALRRWKEGLVEDLVRRPRFDRLIRTPVVSSTSKISKQTVRAALDKLIQARKQHVSEYLNCCRVAYDYCQSAGIHDGQSLSTCAADLKLSSRTLGSYHTTGECVHLAPALLDISSDMCKPSFFSQLSSSILRSLQHYKEVDPAGFHATWKSPPLPSATTAYPAPNAIR